MFLVFSTELRHAFDLFDTDRSGGISVSELTQALSALGVKVSDQQARELFTAIDVDSKAIFCTLLNSLNVFL
jgi:Ca2+-binding EF-hand superfamily protein